MQTLDRAKAFVLCAGTTPQSEEGVSVIELEIEAERSLAEQLEKYAGRWVAVREHAVVADAESLGELLEQIEKSQEEVEGVFRVPEGDASACFF